MISLALTRRALYDVRWHIFWYGFGLGLYAAAMVWLFPAFEETLQALEYPEEILQFFGAGANLADPAVFLTVEYFGFAPLILIIYAVFVATGALAGEESRGTLEILLSEPVSRTRLFLSKVVAIVVATILLLLLVSMGWLLSIPFVDLRGQVSLGGVLAAQVWTLPVVMFYVALGLFLGAVAPSRGQAAGILAALVIAAYLVASLAGVIEPIEWMKYASPYYYADATEILTTGAVWWHQAGLLAATGIAGGLALVAFNGRELAAGVWQFNAILRGIRTLRGSAQG